MPSISPRAEASARAGARAGHAREVAGPRTPRPRPAPESPTTSGARLRRPRAQLDPEPRSPRRAGSAPARRGGASPTKAPEARATCRVRGPGARRPRRPSQPDRTPRNRRAARQAGAGQARRRAPSWTPPGLRKQVPRGALASAARRLASWTTARWPVRTEGHGDRPGSPLFHEGPCRWGKGGFQRRGEPTANIPHGVTRSRSCSIRAGPIPGTASRSSTDRMKPCSAR